MSNCKFPDSFMVCSRISARLRQVAKESEFSPVAVSEAWREAEQKLDEMFPSLVATTPAPVVKPSAASKPSVLFEDRPLMPLPTYTPCFHGMYDKTLCVHCLGTGAAAPYAALDLMEDEPGPEVAELTVVEEQVPVAGQDDGVDDPEQEEDSQEGIADESGLTEDEDE